MVDQRSICLPPGTRPCRPSNVQGNGGADPFFKRKKIKGAYTDHWLSAVIQIEKRLAHSHDSLQPLSGRILGNETRSRLFFQPPDLPRKRLLLSEGPDARRPGRKISPHPVDFSKKQIGPYLIYYHFLNQIRRRPFLTTAGRYRPIGIHRKTALAIDGNIRYALDPKRPQEPGLTYQLRSRGGPEGQRNFSTAAHFGDDCPRQLTILDLAGWPGLAGGPSPVGVGLLLVRHPSNQDHGNGRALHFSPGHAALIFNCGRRAWIEIIIGRSMNWRCGRPKNEEPSQDLFAEGEP